MTGLVGGTITGNGLNEMIDPMQHEPWDEVKRFEEGKHGFGLAVPSRLRRRREGSPHYG